MPDSVGDDARDQLILAACETLRRDLEGQSLTKADIAFGLISYGGALLTEVVGVAAAVEALQSRAGVLRALTQ